MFLQAEVLHGRSPIKLVKILDKLLSSSQKTDCSRISRTGRGACAQPLPSLASSKSGKFVQSHDRAEAWNEKRWRTTGAHNMAIKSRSGCHRRSGEAKTYSKLSIAKIAMIKSLLDRLSPNLDL